MEDISSIEEIFTDEISTKYWLTKCTCLNDVERMLKIEYLNYHRLGLMEPYAIIYKENVVGVCNFNDEINGVARVGFILNRKYEHLGIMTHALKLLIQKGFDAGYHRIEALVFPQNIKSKRTLERVGFIKEGVMISYLKHEGNLYDIDLYALTRRKK